MIVTVGLNPALDKNLLVDGLTVDGVNRVVGSRMDAGGKSINVAKILKTLGGDPLTTGIVGGTSGAFLLSQLDEMGIRRDFVSRDEATRTNLKITNRLRCTTTEFNEPGVPVTEMLLDQVWEKIDTVCTAGDYVVIAGANPPGMDDKILADWVSRLREKNIHVALDTVGAPLHLGIAQKPTIVKPNLDELSEIVGEPLHYMRDILAAALSISRQGVEKVIVSMGADGALFITEDCILRGNGLRVPVGSTVGSGDAMLAAAVYHMEQGTPWEETARWCIAASAANAMCAGSQTPTMEQIKELYARTEVESIM